MTYEYDTAGRMVQLGSSAFGAFSFEHDAASRMNRVLYPNGVDLDLKRDGRGRITEIAFTRSGVYLDGEMRRLDAVGNTTTRERSGEDELRFGYDTLDQLLQVAAGMSVQEVYAYDSVGNWAVDGRRHDACNRLTQDNTRTFDYDRDGNLTSIQDSGGDGSAFYEYDALGRLVGATLSTGETITYRYDAIGRRYAVSTSAGTTFTLFDGWQEIGTVEPDGSSRAMLAVGEFRLAADTASGPMYVHAGLEGSVIALTNVLGELVEKYRYTAFGLLTVLDAEGDEKDSPALSPWLYHGRLYEQSTGLYWMRMRHYSPDLGRFLQPDPAGIAGGINLYAYSNNNPLRYFDPWGLWPAPDASGGDDGEYGEADPMRVNSGGDQSKEEILERLKNGKVPPLYDAPPITADELVELIRNNPDLVEALKIIGKTKRENGAAVEGAFVVGRDENGNVVVMDPYWGKPGNTRSDGAGGVVSVDYGRGLSWANRNGYTVLAACHSHPGDRSFFVSPADQAVHDYLNVQGIVIMQQDGDGGKRVMSVIDENGIDKRVDMRL